MTHRPLSKAHAAWRVSVLACVTAGLLPPYLARRAMLDPQSREASRRRWVKRWAGSLLDTFGVEVIERAAFRPHHERGTLVVANHRSAIDIGVLLRATGGYIVSRADLARWPLLGAAAQSVGTVFVDRSRSESGAAAIRAMTGLLAEGRTLVVFPEGTTFAGDEVRPFRGGAFSAARVAGARIVPAGLAYSAGSSAAFVDETFASHLGRIARTPRVPVALAFGDEESPEGTTRELAERLRQSVQRLVHDARAALAEEP